MPKVKIGQLKAHLSEYLRRVRRGERVTVYDRDEPVAELVPISKKETVWERLAREGKLKLGTQKKWAGPSAPPPRRPFDLARLVLEVQEDES